MASTVLPNGIIIPEKYSRDWYNDLYHNWQELDNLLAGGGANDGTLTIQKNGDTVGTFSANQATDETINIEVPDVNNGTLTIQQNGTTVDSFSANSSTDKTVNVQCVDLTNNQTVGGIKTFSDAPVVSAITLDGKTIDTNANGDMTYDSHIVDTIEEQGDGYIRYSNGIQICWGTITWQSDCATRWGSLYETSGVSGSYAKSFVNTPSVSVLGSIEGYSGIVECTSVGTQTLTPTIYLCRAASNGVATCVINYVAIGKWK